MPNEQKYRAPQPQRKQRLCLRCESFFMSEGPENRLCSSCREYLGEHPPEDREYRVRLHALDSDKQ
jgi:hypothetical protein